MYTFYKGYLHYVLFYRILSAKLDKNILANIMPNQLKVRKIVKNTL